MHATLDYLGENVSTTADAQKARDAYLEIFDRIAQRTSARQRPPANSPNSAWIFLPNFVKAWVLSIAERAAALR